MFIHKPEMKPIETKRATFEKD